METLLIDHASPTELHFDQGGEVVVLDETSSNTLIARKVVISNHTKVHWCGVIVWDSSYSLEFVTQSGESIVRILLLATNNEKLHTTIHSTLASSNTVTDVHILSLVGEYGSIELNWTVQIDTNIVKARWHILEENIFLGSKGSIRWIPSLLVHSDDVEASHAARIERISDEKLYYLRAHGIPRDDASVMMVEGKVRKLFESVEVDVEEILGRVRGLMK